MMGELFLYRNESSTAINAMTFTEMSYWKKWHDYENSRIEKENRKAKNKQGK